MALFKKLFGKKDLTVQLQEAFQRREWAEVVRLSDECDVAAESSLQQMVVEARETLAALNIQEARTRFSQGDSISGYEHLELAKQYGATVEQLQDFDLGNEALTDAPLKPPSKADHSCSSCSGQALPEGGDAELVEAFEADWELLLAGFPESVAAAYMAKSDDFRVALFKAYEGENDAACVLFGACGENDHDAHFFYEYGSALCRAGRFKEGLEFLLAVVQRLPEHRLAWELLLDLDGDDTKVPQIEEKLLQLIENPEMKGFAAAALARIAWRAGDGGLIIQYGELALAAGEPAPDIMQMMAGVLEAREEFQAAEALLSRLPSGGCGGGAHPALAEFWLRRKTHLDQSLEAFKNASRQEPENPRWLLRIAQTYLAKGWRRDGLKLLNQIASLEDLSPDLSREVRAGLDASLINH